MGYSSGFGNGNLVKTPADRLKDVHLAGGVLDLYRPSDSLSNRYPTLKYHCV